MPRVSKASLDLRACQAILELRDPLASLETRVTKETQAQPVALESLAHRAYQA